MAIVNASAVKVYDDVYAISGGQRRHPDTNFVRLIEWGFRPADDEETRTVVEWGFGAGANLIYLLSRGFRVIGLEVSEVATRSVRAALEQRAEFSGKWELHTLAAGSSAAPLADECADLMLASESLYFHSSRDDLQRTLKDCRRILKPNGLFISSMIGPGNQCVREAVQLGEHVHQWTAPGLSTELVLYVIQDEAHARDVFSMFTVLEVGYYDFSFYGKEHFHWVVICRK